MKNQKWADQKWWRDCAYFPSAFHFIQSTHFIICCIHSAFLFCLFDIFYFYEAIVSTEGLEEKGIEENVGAEVSAWSKCFDFRFWNNRWIHDDWKRFRSQRLWAQFKRSFWSKNSLRSNENEDKQQLCHEKNFSLRNRYNLMQVAVSMNLLWMRQKVN